MKHLTYLHAHNVALIVAVHRWVRDLVARSLRPRRSGPHRVNTSARNRSWVSLAALCLALLVQALLIYALGELIDLCVSLMELWAELARKHLEIVNS